MTKPGALSRETALWAANLALEKKARELVLLEVGKISIIADYFIIATAGSAVHLQTICDYLLEQFKQRGYTLLRMEGYREGWWVVLDYGALIIHLLQPDARERYNLERLWSKAPRIEI